MAYAIRQTESNQKTKHKPTIKKLKTMKRNLTTAIAIAAIALLATSCTKECKCHTYNSAAYQSYNVTTTGKCSDLDRTDTYHDPYTGTIVTTTKCENL